ncbi:condensation domain-containing protein, partial [Streptomyces sp. UH6]|uniref:condensation domain-containing protein n=1 Tax=Streptomyces sp. UH6 TaxID=2748379 RepID=UPI0017B8D9D1
HPVWQDVPEPLLVVRGAAPVPVTHLDWSDVAETAREARLRDLLREERERGIDLARAPLQRLTLARLGDDSVRVVWSFHHMVLDGWSLFHVLSDVFACVADPDTAALPVRRPFRDYVAWLGDRDREEAERHWRERLASLDEPTPLPYDREPRESHRAESRETVRAVLPAVTTRALRERAKEAGLTLGTLVQGAWALLLSRHAGRDEVVLGTTVSGRPPELDGAEAMTGLFIATLPTRVTVPRAGTLAQWLRRLQQEQGEDRRHGSVPLTRMKAFTGLPERAGLFDSIVVFENYPVDDGLAAAHGLRLSGLEGVETTNYPLSLVVEPGPELALSLGYDPELFDASTAERLTGHLTVLLQGMADDLDRAPRRLPLLTPAGRERAVRAGNGAVTGAPVTTTAGLFAGWVRRTP